MRLNGRFAAGTEPEVVVDLGQVLRVVWRQIVGRADGQRELLAGRHRSVGILANRRTRLEAQAARHIDLADAAVLHELDRVAHGRPAAVHRADLDDLAETRLRLDHLAAFPDRVRRRLLDVDVLAGLERPDGRERVPVIRRGDDDGVDLLVFEDAAHVLDESGLVVGDAGQARVVDALRGQVRVDVAERLHRDVRQLREAALDRVALTADADAGHDDAIVCAEDAHLRGRAQARPEKLAANRHPCGGRAQPRREVPPRDAVLFMPVVGHVDLLFDLPLFGPVRRPIEKGRCMVTRRAPGWFRPARFYRPILALPRPRRGAGA